MFKKIALVLTAFFITHFSFSQTSAVSGIIQDTTINKMVKNAVVAMLSQKDSSLLHFTRTMEDGSFQLAGVVPGKYIFMVMHPSFADYVEDMEVITGNEKLPVVAVTPKSKLLEAVILKSGNPIRIKGDTTIYTADSFKVSANANVEELLKKMPGIQVDKNGQIKAMGETVEKVLVDGEEFFGDDPGMAVKNLRADAIKEVQVFKKKTDQAEFTGIDDGLSKQTINLKLKENKKTGYFGKIDAAGGLQNNIDDRYNTNLMFSSFKGKRKLSAFLLNGNTGQDGLSWQDREKFGGSDMNFEMSDDGDMMFFSNGGRGSDEEPYINTQNGFIRNVNAGLSYNNKFYDKNTLNFSPKYNSQVYDNNRANFTQTSFAGSDSLLNKNDVTNTHVDRYDFKISGYYDMKIDSSNSLKISLNTNIYHAESEEATSTITTDEKNSLVNTNDRNSTLSSDKQAFGGSALFKHKFKKSRRTFSLNADYRMINSEAENYLKQDFQDFGRGITGRTNQFTDISKSTSTVSSKIVYTEPLSKKFSLELSHELSVNSGKNNQATYSYTPATEKWDTIIDSLTNDFDQKIISNRPSAKISFSDKKIKYNFGLGIDFTQFNLKDITYNKNYDRNYTNFFPTAIFTWNYKSNSSVRFNYNGRTRQPTLNQLQPLRNNNDQFSQYIGNPNLKQSFTNSFSLSTNSYNFLKEQWKYIGINANFTSNAITNRRDINPASGYTVTQPINTNGNMNFGLWSQIGRKLKKANLNLNLNPSLNFNKVASVVNSVTNFTNNLNAGLSVEVSKSKDKKYDISIANEYSYNRNATSLSDKFGKGSAITFFSTNTLSAQGTVYYKKVWSINTDFNFYYRQKTFPSGQNLNNSLWNAKLQRTFKKNEFTAYLQLRDILNQNIGVERNFDGVIYQEERNDRLQRYFMVGFRWDFKNKPPKAKEEVKK